MEKKIVKYDFSKYDVEVFLNDNRSVKLKDYYELESFHELKTNEKERFIKQLMYDSGLREALDDRYELRPMFDGTRVIGYSLRTKLSFRNDRKSKTSLQSS